MKFKLIILGLLISIPSVVYPWGWPTVSKHITSDFGPRSVGGWDFHEGIDIRGKLGDVVEFAN